MTMTKGTRISDQETDQKRVSRRFSREVLCVAVIYLAILHAR